MEILTLAIVGSAVSGIVGFIKTKYGTAGWKSVLSLVIVSIIGGIGYWLIKDANLLEASISVLIAANVLYSLLFKQIREQMAAK